MNAPNISTEIIPSDTSESDSDDILIVDEVHNPHVELQVASSSSNVVTTTEVPSTSRGVVPDDTEKRSSDDVEIVGEVKPRHLRTPVIVSLSSDDENDGKNVVKNEDKTTIEISDSEDEIPAPSFPSPDPGNSGTAANRWSTSSEDEMLGRRRDKGKGKGKGKRSKQKSSAEEALTSSAAGHVTSSATASAEVTSPGSTAEGSLRVASSEPPRTASSLDMTSSTSSAVVEAEERLLEAWRCRMAARSR